METIDISHYKWCTEPIEHIKDVKRPTTRFSKRDICNFTGRTRIGSKSANGEVFLFGTNPDSVIKVIPYRKGTSELGYSRKASSLVKAGKSPFFPVVFHTGKCKETWYSSGSSESSYFIISERAWGDLQYLYREYYRRNLEMTVADWKAVIRQVLSAIFDIQKYLKIIHNDIKFENILVTLSDSKCVQILLSDFGESCDLTSSEQRSYDASRLFDVLSLKAHLPQEILELSEKSTKYVNRHLTDENVVEKVRDRFWTI